MARPRAGARASPTADPDMAKHALIVDDSATARMVLGRLLARHRLVVEAVASAEEALRHLEHARPDVIFMDHQMPGMDGLQALAAIKANPATATIPVMMYTSQAGEVYVGQARALGALGVLPKQVKPVEVSQVLRSLRLIEEDIDGEAAQVASEAAEAAATGPGEGDDSGGRPSAGPGALPATARETLASPDALRELLADLFAQQQQLLRDELRQAVARSEAPVPGYPAGTVTGSGWRWVSGALAVACLLLGTALVLVLGRGAGGDDRLQPAAEIAQPAPDLPAATASMAGGPGLVAAEDWTAAFEWALNQDVRQTASGPLLGDAAAELLRALLPWLETLGWRGTVQLYTHVGRFCLVRSGAGELVPAAQEALLGDCVALGLSEPEARREGLRQSLEFANVLGALSARYAPGIVVELGTFGSDAGPHPYPPESEELPASSWNAQAARNHRLEVRLLPAAEEDP